MSAFLETLWDCEPPTAGEFDCPHCHARRSATRRVVRARLAVFGRAAPLPGGTMTYHTCHVCGHSWDGPSTDAGAGEEGPVGRPFSEDERALAAVVAAVVFSDLTVRQTEKRMVRWVMHRYTGETLGEAGVDRLLRTARTRWGDPLARLRRLACVLDASMKRRIVAAAYLVCAADREMHPEESRLLVRIGEALDMSPRAVRSAIEEAKTVEVPAPEPIGRARSRRVPG